MSSFGSIFSPLIVTCLLIARSNWLTRGVFSTPGATSGTLNVAEFIPGTTRPPTTQPCDADAAGQTTYRVAGVTVYEDPSPLTVVRLGAPAPPACSACVP